MDQIEIEKNRIKKKHQNGYKTEDKKKETTGSTYYAKAFTKILIVIIIGLACAIYINFGEGHKQTFKKIVFEQNFSFTSMNKWYQKHFGQLLPLQIKDPENMVSKEKNQFMGFEKYLDGYKVAVKQDSIIETLNSGIVVFIGPKDGYGNVVIVQGIDGVDIWYGNVDNTNISLYDYIDKNAILGTAKADYIYLLLNKDGQYLEYDEYIKTI